MPRRNRRSEHRAARWTVMILAACLLTLGALVAGVARGHQEARRSASLDHVVSRPVTSLHQAGAVPGVQGGRRATACPVGATPAVVIDDVRVHPALDHGFWFHPGRYRIAVRAHLVNGTNAALRVKGVHWTVGDRPWRARTHVSTAMRSESMSDVVASGPLVSTTRERMALAVRLSWGWQGARARSCGRDGLVDDD
jgi:hypothetical protein